jgi:hypothetical protein
MSHVRATLVPFAALMLATLACTTVTRMAQPAQGVAPGEAPAPTTTASPVEAAATEVRRLAEIPTPTPFHVEGEDDVRNALDLTKPDHIDYFDNPPAWFDYDTPGRAAYRVEDGHLYGKDYEPEPTFSWWSNTDRQSGNVYAEVSATNGDCVDKDAVGLVIRVDREKGAGGYALEVACDGHFRFVNHVQGKGAYELIDWTFSDVINTGKGATNRLGIWGYQGKFEVFVNGVKVGEFLDKDYNQTYGTFALYVKAERTYDLEATFDDFAFWHIPFQP